MSDPRITRIPVVECREPLVDLRTLGVLRLDERLADADGAFAHLRRSVADRAVAAQTLLPRGLRLLVVEGYRPAEVQLRRRAGCSIAPPHVAGAAIDLTLATDSGIELAMGTRNRAILCTALAAMNLVNYPTEWWHWSYGDRYWAFASGAAVAHYGPFDTLADGLKGA